jgi:hypothetical protein
MSMSEVVTVWGKRRFLVSNCYIGPRLWYGRGSGFGDLSLSFKTNRLAVIGISGSTARHLTFDSGLNGEMGRADCESVLGPPTLNPPDAPGTLFVGEIAYRTNGLRTDLRFTGPADRTPSEEKLDFISVRLEKEAETEKRGEAP